VAIADGPQSPSQISPLSDPRDHVAASIRIAAASRIADETTATMPTLPA
jgi:hypothetical protein